MEEKTVLNGLRLIWRGLLMSGRCACHAWWKSFIGAFVDTAYGVVKHPIEALLILSVMIWQFVIICEQRQERDQTMVKDYKRDCTLDSLKTQADFQQHYIAKLKHGKEGFASGSKEAN